MAKRSSHVCIKLYTSNWKYLSTLTLFRKFKWRSIFLKLPRIFNHDPNTQDSSASSIDWRIWKKINKLRSSIIEYPSSNSVQKYQLSYRVTHQTQRRIHKFRKSSSWKFHAPRNFLAKITSLASTHGTKAEGKRSTAAVIDRNYDLVNSVLSSELCERGFKEGGDEDAREWLQGQVRWRYIIPAECRAPWPGANTAGAMLENRVVHGGGPTRRLVWAIALGQFARFRCGDG